MVECDSGKYNLLQNRTMRLFPWCILFLLGTATRAGAETVPITEWARAVTVAQDGSHVAFCFRDGMLSVVDVNQRRISARLDLASEPSLRESLADDYKVQMWFSSSPNRLFLRYANYSGVLRSGAIVDLSEKPSIRTLKSSWEILNAAYNVKDQLVIGALDHGQGRFLLLDGRNGQPAATIPFIPAPGSTGVYLNGDATALFECARPNGKDFNTDWIRVTRLDSGASTTYNLADIRFLSGLPGTEGRFLAVTDFECPFKASEMQIRTASKTVAELPGIAGSLSFSRDERFLFSVAGNHFLCYDLPARKVLVDASLGILSDADVEYDRGKNRVIVGALSQKVLSVNLGSGQVEPLCSLDYRSRPVPRNRQPMAVLDIRGAVCPSKDRVLLATHRRTALTWDDAVTIGIWDATTGKKLHDFSDPVFGQVVSAASDTTGSMCVLTLMNGETRLYDLAQGSLLATIRPTKPRTTKPRTSGEPLTCSADGLRVLLPFFDGLAWKGWTEWDWKSNATKDRSPATVEQLKIARLRAVSPSLRYAAITDDTTPREGNAVPSQRFIIYDNQSDAVVLSTQFESRSIPFVQFFEKRGVVAFADGAGKGPLTFYQLSDGKQIATHDFACSCFQTPYLSGDETTLVVVDAPCPEGWVSAVDLQDLSKARVISKFPQRQLAQQIRDWLARKANLSVEEEYISIAPQRLSDDGSRLLGFASIAKANPWLFECLYVEIGLEKGTLEHASRLHEACSPPVRFGVLAR